ncbi:hypothetical protein [Amycolatopsis acidicola]|uniref:hypothetical protein n=1 Tax=Amycolatopsis acidicola TaxID=2596893 RepID=UPI00140DA1DB|nr:hypothetical protein [Amycolatopsis acidicola]
MLVGQLREAGFDVAEPVRDNTLELGGRVRMAGEAGEIRAQLAGVGLVRGR